MAMIKTGDAQRVKDGVRTVMACKLIECKGCHAHIPDIKPICPKCGYIKK